MRAGPDAASSDRRFWKRLPSIVPSYWVIHAPSATSARPAAIVGATFRQARRRVAPSPIAAAPEAAPARKPEAAEKSAKTAAPSPSHQPREPAASGARPRIASTDQNTRK